MKKEETAQPHIKLKTNARYSRVIICGAPERAALIASRLENCEPQAKNREYHSYLGQHQGKDILVCSHGVGASGAVIGIQELINVGAKTIIRLGTAGTLLDDGKIGDVVVATGGVREEGVSQLMVPVNFPAIPDLGVTQTLISTFEKKNIKVRPGILISSDLFYPGLLDNKLALYQKAGAAAVEMECSALFITGTLRGIKTGSVVVCDGNPLKWQEGHYDPTSTALADSMSRCIDVVIESIAAAT